MARLGTALPFAEARDLLELVLGIALSEATVRRQTYVIGEAALAVAEAERVRLEQELPEPPVAPERVQLSLDATKVPILQGAHTEVKVAAFADLVPTVAPDGTPDRTATNVSYVARWSAAEDFAPHLTVEAHRRGLDRAERVVSPNDGALWIQHVLDEVVPQAIRILDEPHAAEHLGLLGAILHGEGTPAAARWTSTQRDRLLTEPPAALLADLAEAAARGPHARAPTDPSGLTPTQVLAREVAYFQTRADQLAYAAFRAAHDPIGSGLVESGHKVLISPRFKRAGQHWALPHLNPLLELRTLVANDRWHERWPAVVAQQRQTVLAAQQAVRARHAATRSAASPQPVPPPAPPLPPPPPVSPPAAPAPRSPAPTHPWRYRCLPPRHAAAS